MTDLLNDASIGRGLAQQGVALLQTPCGSNVPVTVTTGGPNWKALVARANRTPFFRRALKIVNGGLNSLPNGLTIVGENPVYVQGNYNSDGNFVTAGSVPASVIADAVTLLSNAWNDLRSFNSPTNSMNRVATTTSYRMAVVTGKGIPFPQPAGTDASFGSDGGAHNFVRSLEDWDNGGDASTAIADRWSASSSIGKRSGRSNVAIRMPTTVAPAIGRSTQTSCRPRACRRARRCSATSTR